MNRFVLVISLTVLTLALLGKPAPTGVGILELLMIGFTGVAVVGGMILGRLNPSFDRKATILLVSLYAYMLSWMASCAMGLHYGVDFAPLFRAIVSYVVFVPLVGLGIFFKNRSNARDVYWALIMAGAAHALYLLYLYLTKSGLSTSVSDVLRQRTAYEETRATVQIFFSLAILPMAWIGLDRRGAIAGVAVLTGLSAAFSTQTRSQLIALICGYISFYYIFNASKQGKFVNLMVIVNTVKYLVIGLIVSVIAYFIVPIFRLWISILQQRTEMVGDNGRLDEEWIPAISYWYGKGIKNVILGIGAGTTFTTLDGMPRTYIHNFTIYILVYNGVFGLVTATMLFGSVMYIFWYLSNKYKDRLSMAMASLLVAMVVYAQMFAVHKLLSFNIMVYLIAAFALLRLAYFSRALRKTSMPLQMAAVA